MSKHLWYVFSSLVLFTLLISACQPTVVFTETPTTAPSTTALPTASPIPEMMPAPEPLWDFETGGAIWGTPAINAGTVYFGSDDGNLYAVDAQTGSLKWKFTTQGIVRSQPAIAKGLVYFASDDGYLYAVDAQNGKQTWRTDIGNALERQTREKLGTNPSAATYDYEQSSPIVVDEQVYVGSLDGNIYSLSADSGQVTWRYQTDGKVRATPVLDNGNLYIGSWDGYSYALDTKTGQLLWKTSVGCQVQSTALVADGLVYTASRKASVFALDAQTGQTRWEYSYGENMWVESSPILVNGILYIGSSGSKWIMGLDGQTGQVFTTFYSVAIHWSTPAIVDNMLFIGGTSYKDDENNGGLYGLKLVDGKFASEFAIKSDRAKWLFFPVPGGETAEGNWSGVASSPVVVDGIVYVGGLDGKLYAIKTTP